MQIERRLKEENGNENEKRKQEEKLWVRENYVRLRGSPMAVG